MNPDLPAMLGRRAGARAARAGADQRDAADAQAAGPTAGAARATARG